MFNLLMRLPDPGLENARIRSLDRHVGIGPDLLHADLLRVPADGHEEILLVTPDFEHTTYGRPHLRSVLHQLGPQTLHQNALDDLGRRKAERIGSYKGIGQVIATEPGKIPVEEHGSPPIVMGDHIGNLGVIVNQRRRIARNGPWTAKSDPVRRDP